MPYTVVGALLLGGLTIFTNSRTLLVAADVPSNARYLALLCVGILWAGELAIAAQAAMTERTLRQTWIAGN